MTTIEFQYELISLQKKLMFFALKLTSDMEKAKDLLQETNLKALNYRDKFANNTNMYSWTYTIMKNTFINGYKYNLNHINISKLFKGTAYDFHTNFDKTDNPDSIYMSKELKSIIDSLEYNLKKPFNMFIEGYKYAEIADDLGLKVGTVKSRIFHARKKLMTRLTGDFNHVNSKEPCNWESF
ncbi:MAG: RNA polymerase sigma factor [Bacteroidales bacterium]|nr:RNA polymerase sigma factor [Bacteroidales bacterium]